MTEILKIFCLFLAIKLGQSSIDYLKNIREDYCMEYCGNECLVNSIKRCYQINNTIYTDKYNLTLKAQNLTLFWITDLIDFDSLIQLNSSTNNTNIKLKKLSIHCEKNKETQLYQRFQYQKAFGIKQLEGFVAENENNKQSLYIDNETLHLNLLSFSGHLNSSVWNKFIMQSTDKYKTISFRGFSIRPIFELNNKIFANQTNLEKLEFFNMRIEKLTSAVFVNLRTLKTLNFVETHVTNYSFLSSSTLQQNLLNIRMTKDWINNWSIFENFQKLEIITLSTIHMVGFKRNVESKRLRAFVCDADNYEFLTNCIFTFGTNNVTCPEKCNCYLDSIVNRRFIVNCADKTEEEILPILPIPITGNVSLYFENKNLKKLPYRTSIGYANVQKLHLRNNKLKTLSIDQLPLKLKYLDIRENPVVSLDNKVAEYFWESKDELTFLQSGILWKCKCENKAFVNYLGHLQRTREVEFDPFERHFYDIRDEPPRYYQLNGTCPVNCFCCFNSTNKHFIIDCRNGSYSSLDFPDLPNHIIGDSAVLLDNNSIEYLPNLLNSELRQLHLSNNRLSKLWINQLPLNLTFLDLRNNNLVELDDDIMTILEKKQIHLAGNPWQCSCQNKKLLTYLKNNESSEYKLVLKRCSGSDYCPESCFCCMEEDKKLYKIDCNKQKLQEIPRLPEVYNIKLLFESNNLTIVNNSTEGFNNIKELHLKLNKIKKIISIPSNISYLDIRNNSMRKLSDSVLTSLTVSMPKVYMSGNKWICHCDELYFLRYTKEYALNISDLCRTECSNSKMLVKVEEKDVCSNRIPIFAFVFIVLLILGALMNWLQFFWKSLSMWLYEHNILVSIIGLRKLDNDKKYDCFLAYCHKDSDFLQEFIDILENEPSNLRLCYYARDWLPGEPIPECICKSVEESKRIIILMTKNFLKSVWGRLEFRMSLHATAKDKCKRLIVVVYSDVESFDDLDSELKTYMKLNTYLKRDDPNFWDKLIIAMPKNVLEDNNIEITDDLNEFVEIKLNVL